MLDTVKQHPVLSVAALLATVAVVFYVSSGDGEGAAVVVGQDPNAIAAGTALQQSQMQQQVQIAGIGAGLQAEMGKQATAVALADIQGKYSYDVALLASGVQLAAIDKESQTRQLESTLAAQSEQKRIQATTDQAAITSQTMIQTTQTVANALVQQSAQQAQVAMASINKQCSGFFDCLF